MTALIRFSVAATNEKGELSNYSNYGKEKVDIAAPGSDILSTYAEDCYNPSIYSAEKQKEVTQKLADFDGKGSLGQNGIRRILELQVQLKEKNLITKPS